MIEFVQGKRNIIMTLAILFVVVSLSGTTYSLFFNAETTNVINYNTGVLNLEIIEDKKIVLANTFPTIDSDGMKGEPYKLTIKNTGTVPYIFDLRMLSSTSDNTVDTKYIKVMVDNNTPKTLYETSNTISSNVILYPGEEKVFSIRVWLDNNTPNQELGKTFVAKIVTDGESTYKTQDKSKANRPILINNMIPVYYDENTSTWNKADKNNISEITEWYDYSSQKWANVIMIKDSKKQIYDITGKHNIQIDKVDHNNTNVVISKDYLDLGVKNTKTKISTLLRIKYDSLADKQVYMISNSNTEYYYDTEEKKFILKIGNIKAKSDEFNLEEKKWYILGYTYDEESIYFYINGTKIGTDYLSLKMNTNSTFKLGTNSSKEITSNITIGDVYIYSKILSEKEIETNYKTNINVIYDSLIAGFNNFVPMTTLEYYNNLSNGSKIKDSDIISMYVWIPRFKYQLFNATGNLSDLSETYTKGINIVFENEKESTGTIYCKDYACYSDNLMITKLTENDNGKYYTHPAFTTKDGEVTGFWISKYEISQDNDTINSIKGVESLTETSIAKMYKLIKNIDSNYHMITNTEWGAVTYLAKSIYGTCPDNNCKDMVPNKDILSGKEKYDSTTNNNYGVYDMNGLYAEYVMASFADKNGNILLNNNDFSNIAVSNNDYDLYKDSFILGDATNELLQEDSNWIHTFMDNTNNWLIRGGINIEENANMYSYRSSNGDASEYISTRITIK